MKEPSPLRLLIADDHAIVRLGLTALVNTEPDLRVVAEAADGQQAVEAYLREQPDVALLDVRMPVLSGTEAAQEIRRRFPSAHLLMLTAFDGDEDIFRALEAGAEGYVLKSSSGERLIPAIRAVAAGQRWIPREVAARLAARAGYEPLTPRELDVLRHAARGLANKEIAAALRLSEHTVKDHVKSILGKLRAADRTEAVTAALQRGIIQLER